MLIVWWLHSHSTEHYTFMLGDVTAVHVYITNYCIVQSCSIWLHCFKVGSVIVDSLLDVTSECLPIMSITHKSSNHEHQNEEEELWASCLFLYMDQCTIHNEIFFLQRERWLKRVGQTESYSGSLWRLRSWKWRSTTSRQRHPLWALPLWNVWPSEWVYTRAALSSMPV